MDSTSSPSSSAKFSKPGPRSCLCSPTTHPGSFRCRLHKSAAAQPGSEAKVAVPAAKAKSMRAALLTQIIRRPSSNHDQYCRRRDFTPRPSRFFMMNSLVPSS
ncbi:hypothetical protein Cni_G27867 [Canna indica]|uniref:Serine-rich protein-like protein n=1 Tax=Canna indica TaxID=4628 RepID=A0AAQ3L2P5_9LILI|nr:hypothetical protein Cni_G27867 [Canna indica]